MTVSGCKNELFVKLIADEFGAMKVVVCPQDLALEPGPICWYKDPDSPFDFTFKHLDIVNPPFEITELNEDRICVDHDTHISFYTYTIVVTYDGGLYDTLQPTCEEQDQWVVFSTMGGKPVIRPK